MPTSAVAERLRRQPLDRVVAVAALVVERREDAVRGVAAAHVDDEYGVAGLGELERRRQHAGGADRLLVVRGAADDAGDGRALGGAVEVAARLDAVAQRHRDVLLDEHPIDRHRRASRKIRAESIS